MTCRATVEVCLKLKLKLKFICDWQSASLSWCRAPIWSPWPDFFFLSDDWWFLDVGHPLWQEDGSVIYLYNCFWALPEQWLWVEVPQNSRPDFTVSFETPQLWGPGPHIYIPWEQGGPVIPPPPGTGFSFVTSYDSQSYDGGILTHLHLSDLSCPPAHSVSTSNL
jgi:hypothetical protein